MPQQMESVVTPERFAQGLSYDKWFEGIETNQERFKDNYEEFQLSGEDAAAFKELAQRPDGAAKCLALGEAWCPDVFRGLPVMARIAEASGMELRVFFRDQNKDIMAEFLNHGESESIPTFVFYTRDHRYITHWIERPALAEEEMPKLRELTAPLRDPDLPAEERQKYIQAYIDFQHGPVWDGWRHAAAREIRELLEQRS